MSFCIPIPSRIERTDVGKLINKSLGDVEVRLCIQRLQEGREDALLDHTQSASQYISVHILLVRVRVCVLLNGSERHKAVRGWCDSFTISC